MSGMRTFTVRELDRAPGAVLAACDQDGEARIRHRDGRTYRLRPEAGPPAAISQPPDFAARRRKLFRAPLSVAFARKLDQAIRGE
jgi:hypothetical protein